MEKLKLKTEKNLQELWEIENRMERYLLKYHALSDSFSSRYFKDNRERIFSNYKFEDNINVMTADEFDYYIEDLLNITREIVKDEFEIEIKKPEDFGKYSDAYINCVQLSGFIMEGKSKEASLIKEIHENCIVVSECDEIWRREKEGKSLLESKKLHILIKYVWFLNVLNQLGEQIEKINKRHINIIMDRSSFDHDIFDIINEGVQRSIPFMKAMFDRWFTKNFRYTSIEYVFMENNEIPWPIMDVRKFEQKFYKDIRKLRNYYKSFYGWRSLGIEACFNQVRFFNDYNLEQIDDKLVNIFDRNNRMDYIVYNKRNFLKKYVFINHLKFRNLYSVKRYVGNHYNIINYLFYSMLLKVRELYFPNDTFLLYPNYGCFRSSNFNGLFNRVDFFAIDGFIMQGKSTAFRKLKKQYDMDNVIYFTEGILTSIKKVENIACISEGDEIWRRDENYILKYKQEHIIYIFLYNLLKKCVESDFDKTQDINIILDRGLLGVLNFKNENCNIAAYFDIMNSFICHYICDDKFTYRECLFTNEPYDCLSDPIRSFEREIYSNVDEIKKNTSEFFNKYYINMVKMLRLEKERKINLIKILFKDKDFDLLDNEIKSIIREERINFNKFDEYLDCSCSDCDDDY